MSTLTPMERTTTGWKCPRCGDTREEDLLPVRAVECNCAGLGIEATSSPHAWVDTSDMGFMAAAAETLDVMRHAVDAAVGIPDAFRHGLSVTLTPEQLCDRYKEKP